MSGDISEYDEEEQWRGRWEAYKMGCESLSKHKVILIYSALCLCNLVRLIDSQIGVVSAPNILSYYTKMESIGQLFALSYLASALGQPFWATFSDLIGRGAAFTCVLVVYIIGSIAAGLSPVFELYVMSIATTWFASSGIAVLIKVLMADIFDSKVRGKWSAYYESTKLVTAWCGPYLAQYFIQYNWRLIYLLNTSLALICLIPVVICVRIPSPFALRVGQGPGRIKKVLNKIHESMDIGGIILLSTGAGLLLYGLKKDWGSTKFYLIMMASLIVFLILGIYEAFVAHPRSKIFTKDIICNRNAIGACITLAITDFAVKPYFIFLSLFLQVVQESKPSTAGLMFGIYWTLSALSRIFVGHVMELSCRWKPWTFIGLSLGFLGIILQLILSTNTGLWLSVVINVALGFGTGMYQITLMVAGQDSVSVDNIALLTALLGLLRYLSPAISCQVSTYIWRRQLEKSFEHLIWNTKDININLLSNNIDYILCTDPELESCLDPSDLPQVQAVYVSAGRTIIYICITIFAFSFLSVILMKGTRLDRKREKMTKPLTENKDMLLIMEQKNSSNSVQISSLSVVK